MAKKTGKEKANRMKHQPVIWAQANTLYAEKKIKVRGGNVVLSCGLTREQLKAHSTNEDAGSEEPKAFRSVNWAITALGSRQKGRC